MKYCSSCGSTVEIRVPEGDSRPRHVCTTCGEIHYQNPRVVAGCIVEWEEKILLCRRAIKPRYGLWTLPGGFMENGETVQAGAARETMEETRAKVEIYGLHTLFSLPHIQQVYMMFRAGLKSHDFGPGPESLEVELMNEKQIPWDEMAFPVITETLKLYYADRKAGSFGGPHIGEMRLIQGDGPRRFETIMM